MSKPDSGGEAVTSERDESQPPTDPRFYRLRNATAMGDYEAARQMIEDDPTIVRATNSIGETALHFLVVENYLDAVEFLASHGSSVNNRNAFDQSALHEAATLGYVQMVDLLLRLGARPKSVAEGKRIVKAAKGEKGRTVAIALRASGVLCKWEIFSLQGDNILVWKQAGNDAYENPLCVALKVYS